MRSIISLTYAITRIRVLLRKFGWEERVDTGVNILVESNLQ